MATRKQGMIECAIGAVVGTVLAMGLCLALGGCGQSEKTIYVTPDGGGDPGEVEGFFDGPYADCVRMCEDAAAFYSSCDLPLFQDVEKCVWEVWSEYMLSPGVCSAASRCYTFLIASEESIYCEYAWEVDGRMLDPGWEGYDAPPITWVNTFPPAHYHVVQPDWFSDAYRDLGGEGPAQCGKE